MSLHVVTGAADAAVTYSIQERLIDAARTGTGALLLVPSARDVSRATEVLAGHAAIGVTIRTFDDHLSQLWAALGDGRQIVTATQRLVVLEESVNLWKPTSLGVPVRSRGVTRALVTIVQRVAEAGDVQLMNETATGPGADLLSCARIYGELLQRAGLVERAEAHRLACACAGGVRHPSFVAVEGFSGLTRAQEEFLLGISRFTDVMLELTFDDAVPATFGSAGLVRRFVDAGAERIVVDGAEGEDPTELTRIRLGLGSSDGTPIMPQGAVALSEAWGEQSEAARIVREIQDALAGGTRPGEVAVVFRAVAPHMRDLQSALDEAGIPAEYDAKIPFQATGIGRTILLLLELVGPEGSYRGLADVLRAPYSPATHELLDELDAYVRGSRDIHVRRAEAWLRHRSPETATFIAEARRACRETGQSGAERRWYRLVNGMLGRAHGAAVSMSPAAIADSGAVRVFVEAIRSMSTLDVRSGGAPTLAAALAEAEVALAPAGSRDHVQVMGAERARGRRYECVIVGGLTAGEFPRRTGQDALSAPGIAQAFASAGVDLAPRSDLDAERLLFYLAATRACRRLVLSWQSHDAEGRPVRPSVFLDEVLDLYRTPDGERDHTEGLPHRVLRLDSQSVHPEGPDTNRRERRVLASRPADGGSPGDAGLAEARRRALCETEKVAEAVRAANADREVFSASEIETYLQCPYRWFVDRMVRPRELDERFDSSSAGRLAHDVMKRFYDVFVARSGLTRVTPESVPLARAVHAEVAAAAVDALGAATAADAAAVRAMVQRTLRLVETDAVFLPGFSPDHREWSFGAGEDPPERFEGFSLAGRIDRIDISDASLVVTDYKSGASASARALAKFESEGLVQLPLYASVASRRFGLPVAGGIYRPFGGGKPRGFVLDTLASPDFVRTDVVDDERVAAEIEAATERARKAVAGMRAGEIQPGPRGATCPGYCGAKGFCQEWRQPRG